jgi:hypothetical protein
MGENDNEDRSRNSGRHESLRLDEALKQRLEGLVPEVIKRTFYAGLGAVFTTEEGIRRLANEFSLPKEVASYLVQQAQSTKNELFRIVATELRGFLESLNLNEELQRLLTSLSFEIKTEIRFIPNDAKVVKPSIKNRVTVKRNGGEEPPPEEDAPPAEEDSDI